MRSNCVMALSAFLLLPAALADARLTVTPGPSTISCFDTYEIVVKVDPPPRSNPFTDIGVTATFTPQGGSALSVEGFCDEQQGRILRVRFCPSLPDCQYAFSLTTNLSPDEEHTGSFRTTGPTGMEPVVVDPGHPKHFRLAMSEQPFYHMGITAYHLMDVSNDDDHIRDFLDYCVRNGFNKVRFLLTGYPRDTDARSKEQYTWQGDPWKLPNYGAPPGEVNPLPAWLGKPHKYDFSRFNVAYWQKVDRAVRAMRQRGIVATCIVTIEKQNLPGEYGTLTEHERRLYRYAVARLAAFCNVWWDLGNEHNEYRQPNWAPQMGRLAKEWDAYDRLCSAHGYADWLYGDQAWADYIITQQYGTCTEVNKWAVKYHKIAKPYVNEEYGYEGELDKPGHGMNTDWVRRCHWSLALAGGYATYGDWSPGTAFYTGHIGRGKAPLQLRHLRETFESLPYPHMEPRNDLVTGNAFCLAKLGEVYLVYLPEGGETVLHAEQVAQGHTAEWIDPRTGKHRRSVRSFADKIALHAPSSGDWAVIVKINP